MADIYSSQFRLATLSMQDTWQVKCTQDSKDSTSLEKQENIRPHGPESVHLDKIPSWKACLASSGTGPEHCRGISPSLSRQWKADEGFYAENYHD
jgi:hypothetical protein